MIFSNFKTVFRNFHRTKDLCNGLQLNIPAAGVTGNYTCRTTSAVLNTPSISESIQRCLHTRCTGLTAVQPLVLQQKRFVRKVYPDPFEQDPFFYELPEEDGPIDIHHVPVLSNNGPALVEEVHAAVKGDMGRLFALIHIDGKQRKITTEDVLVVNGFFPPQIGERIRLEKIMLVGSKDFTLFGRPLLSRDLVKVEATVIEKTLSHIRVDFDYKKRFRRLKLLQNPQAVLVINSIELNPSALQ